MNRFEIYEAKDGWRWRVKAGNNEIVGSGESHPTHVGARRAAERFKEIAASATINELPTLLPRPVMSRPKNPLGPPPAKGGLRRRGS